MSELKSESIFGSKRERDYFLISFLGVVFIIFLLFSIFEDKRKVYIQPETGNVYQGDIITYDFDGKVKYILHDTIYCAISIHHYKNEKQWLVIDDNYVRKREHIKSFETSNERVVGTYTKEKNYGSKYVIVLF